MEYFEAEIKLVQFKSNIITFLGGVVHIQSVDDWNFKKNLSYPQRKKFCQE